MAATDERGGALMSQSFGSMFNTASDSVVSTTAKHSITILPSVLSMPVPKT